MKKHGAIKKLYLVLVLIFLYAPILTLVILSFNQSKSRAKWGGFTLEWYSSLFEDEAIMGAFQTTLVVALCSALIATIIGTAACIGMQEMRRRQRSILTNVANIPLLNADIVTGVSLMLLFIACRMTMGYTTVLLSHITFNIPYVILSVMPRYRQLNRTTYEAARDLGAGPIYAFYRIVLPDLMPAILSGFLMSFTMSFDDFIITHFTKGPGFDTLSTKIYTEIKKGIRPEIYALSTLMFATVLVLLFIVNYLPKASKAPKGPRKKATLVTTLSLMAVMTLGALGLSGCAATDTNYDDPDKLFIYNWGEYIDYDILDEFTEETGIEIVYDEYETNEIMYPKIESGAVKYDLVCPSDYMIQKMRDNDLLQPINMDHVPNRKNIGEDYWKMSQAFDPDNTYSLPYCWGTVGILYNKAMVKEPIDSWSVLWDERYADNILMQDSVRDAMMVALKYLGYSCNTTDEKELREATELLKKQKLLTQAYVVDQVRDKMIGEEAAIGVIYSGEAIYTQRENPNLEYVVPKEGSNIWIDSWVIPKNAEHVENAEKFLDFLCRPEIAFRNFDYITYSTPNIPARDLIEDEDIRNSEIAFPDLSKLHNLETYYYLGEEEDRHLNALWREVKSY
ncbi:MAG: extracellular solute-binding protein [Lachnospiraceae bacterium]|nr:extracellular solute-binding protein [Lachnospiraceae bacterium]